MRIHVRAVATLAGALGTVLALAGPASAEPDAVIAMPSCCVSSAVELGGNVFALSQQGDGPEQPTLVRIDPGTNAITGSLGLLDGTAAGNGLDASPMAVGAGSIWVVAYFENKVQRVDPVTMTVTAAISVGRSPSSVVYDGHSLWVALNNAQAVIRIDPAHNVVTQTVHVGSKDNTDDPWQLAYDGADVLASMPTGGRVARIDPSTGNVRYDAVGTMAAACANLLPAPGGYWLDDTECSPFYYRWNARAGRITSAIDPTTDIRHDWGAVVHGNALYTAEFVCGDTGCTHGHLVKRDVVTGAEITQRNVGTEAMLPHYVAGSFWVGDFDDGTLQRVANF